MRWPLVARWPSSKETFSPRNRGFLVVIFLDYWYCKESGIVVKVASEISIGNECGWFKGTLSVV